MKAHKNFEKSDGREQFVLQNNQECILDYCYAETRRQALFFFKSRWTGLDKCVIYSTGTSYTNPN